MSGNTELGDLLKAIARAGIPRPAKLPQVVCELSFLGDYIAYDLNSYEGGHGPVGYGDTREEAIEDLLISIEERFSDDKRERLNGSQVVDRELEERDL